MIDLTRMFSDYSIDYVEGPTKDVSAAFIGVSCPFCGKSGYHGGFARDTSKGVSYNCWVCGTHSGYKALQILLGTKYINPILEAYSDDSIMSMPSEKKIIEGVDKVLVPGGNLDWYHKKYLEKRRYDPDYLVQKYHITGTTPSDTFGARIYFPIIYQGEVASYQGRSIDKNAYLRYLTAAPDKERVHHKNILFNYDNAIEDFIVLVEGIFDSIRLGDGAVCTFGTTFKREQLLLLKDYKRIFLLYDDEHMAQVKARKAAADIQNIASGEVSILNLGNTGDPDDLADDDAKYLMNELRRRYY